MVTYLTPILTVHYFLMCELLLASLQYNKMWMWSGVQFGKRGSVVKVKWAKHMRGEYSLHFVKTTPTYSKQYNRTCIKLVSLHKEHCGVSVKCRMK